MTSSGRDRPPGPRSNAAEILRRAVELHRPQPSDGLRALHLVDAGEPVIDTEGIDEVGEVIVLGLPDVSSRRRRAARGWRLPLRSRSVDVVLLGEVSRSDPVPWATAREVRRVLWPGGVVVSVVSSVDRRSASRWPDPRSAWFAAGLQVLERSWSDDTEQEVLVARRHAPSPRHVVRRLLAFGERRRAAAAAAMASAVPEGPSGVGLAGVAGRGAAPGAAEGALDGLDRAAAVWDVAARQAAAAPPEISQRDEWQAHPRSQAHIRERVGNHFAGWLGDHTSGPGGRAVSIGCGRAATEVELVASGRLGSVDLFDISEGSLRVAAAHAERCGVSERVRLHQGAFRPELVESPADVVLFLNSLHHVEDLEGVLDGVVSILAPDGAVVADEYIGPRRFGFPDHELEHARRAYRLLHPGLRCGEPQLPTPTPEEVAAVDPTEAVRSDEILDQLGRRFTTVDVAAVGGGFAFPLWMGLDHDAVFESERGDELVAWILAHDALLTDSGLIDPYFAYLAATAPKASGVPSAGK